MNWNNFVYKDYKGFEYLKPVLVTAVGLNFFVYAVAFVLFPSVLLLVLTYIAPTAVFFACVYMHNVEVQKINEKFGYDLYL